MKIDLRSALTCATLLVAVVLAYADIHYSVMDLRDFRKVAEQKIERLTIQVSHLRSWLDEGVVSAGPVRRSK